MSEPFSTTFPNIGIEGDAGYVLRTRQVLTQIQGRRTGLEILGELRNLAACVTIEPWTTPGVHNSTTDSVGPRTVRIRYSSAPWYHRRRPDGTYRCGPGWSADSVLCHELVHAVRMAATCDGTLVSSSGDRRDAEEVAATHITNIYLSERNEALKAYYHGDDILDPEAFFAYPPNIDLIRQIAMQQPTFTHRLAQIPAPFNPFAPSPRGCL